MIAIIRNDCSGSIGTGARNHSVCAASSLRWCSTGLRRRIRLLFSCRSRASIMPSLHPPYPLH